MWPRRLFRWPHCCFNVAVDVMHCHARGRCYGCCQTPPSGPQGSSLRHGVPDQVHLSTREGMSTSATAAGSWRLPIPYGPLSVAAAPLPLPSAPLVRGDTPPGPSARDADPRGRRSDVPSRPSRGARPQRRASAPPPLCAARPWRHNPVAVRAGR